MSHFWEIKFVLATSFIKFKKWKSLTKQNENQSKLNECPYSKFSSNLPKYYSSVQILNQGPQSIPYFPCMHICRNGLACFIGTAWRLSCHLFGSSNVPIQTLYRSGKMPKPYDFVPQVQVIFSYNYDFCVVFLNIHIFSLWFQESLYCLILSLTKINCFHVFRL